METFKTAKDIDLEKVLYIDGIASVNDALQVMKDNDVEVLIIKKRNVADANGILTIEDIIRGVVIPNRSFNEVSVYEIMLKPVISIPSHLNVRYVPRLLFNANISVAPVEENGKYIGIVSYRHFLYTEI
jgi:signal-transduction protein with cAMP-binding, CBS, and nucleotidyltransferase domain